MSLLGRYPRMQELGVPLAVVAALAIVSLLAPPTASAAPTHRRAVPAPGGRPGVGYPSVPKPPSKEPRNLASPATTTDPQGDSVSVSNLTVATDNSNGSVACVRYTDVWAGDHVPFCAYVTVVDSVTGEQTTPDNAVGDYVYDACGHLVDYKASVGWHVSGSDPEYFSSSEIPTLPTTIPTSGSICYGMWTVDYIFTQTFTDNVVLSDTASKQFLVQISAATIAAHNPQAPLVGGPILAAEQYGGCPCGQPTHAQATADPIDTATGNFWHTFDDLGTPGRGPSLDLTRTYNSLAAKRDGPFGYGWTDSYALSLTLGDSLVVVNQANGAQASFTLNGDKWAPPPRVLATLTHNGDGTWTFTQRARTTYDFDATGRLTAIKDLNGYATTVAYPSDSEMVVTDPAGRSFKVVSSNGHIDSVSDASSLTRTVQYFYDASGNLTDVIDVGGGNWQFTYDDQHRLLTMRSPRYYGDTTTTPSPVVTNHYDASGRVDWQSDQLGQTTSFDYDSIPDSTKVTDPKGNVTVDEYTYGLLTAVTRGYGSSRAATWYYRYDPATTGRTMVIDPYARVTSSEYDSVGNLLSRTDPLNRTTTYTYSVVNDVTSITEPKRVNGNPVTTTMSYDDAGNLLTRSAPLLDSNGTTTAMATTSYHYDDSAHPGDITSATDPNGNTTHYGYDAFGDLTSVTDPEGDRTTYGYDTSRGLRTSMVAPKGNADGGNPADYTTTYAYDAYGRLTRTRDPLWTSENPRLHETSRHYDADGNLDTSTDGNTHTTSYDYDAAGHQTAAHRPNGTSLRTDYWPDGSIKAQYDGAGQATSYTYDPLGHLSSITDPLSRETDFSYDALGNLLTKRDPAGRTTTNAYDADEELTSTSFSDGTTPNITNISYDSDGQRTTMTDGTGTTSWTWDSLHRMTSSTNGRGSTVAYDFDLGGRLTSIDYPGATGAVTRGYDDANRLHTVTDWNGKTTTFQYDPNSNLQTEVYPNGTTATSNYDAADRPVNISDAPSSNPNTPFASFSYTRDGNGQVTSVDSTGVPADDHNYTYDQINRLTAVDQADYSYDNADNLTQQSDGAQQFYNTAHQLTASSSSPPISLVGTASAGNDLTTSVSLTLPSATEAGDQVILATTLDSGKSVTTPTGYRIVGTYTSDTSKTAAKVIVYQHSVTSGETSVTLKYQNKFAKSAVLAVYRSAHPSNPIDIAAAGATASGTTVTAPSSTPAGTGDRLLMIAGADGSVGGFTMPNDMTSQVSAIGGVTDTALADRALGSPAPTGTHTAAYTNSTQLVGVLIALTPAETTYRYDANGNRTSRAALDGSTTQLGYDQADRLTSYGTDRTFTYDGDGLRADETVSGTTSPFTWDEAEGMPLLLSEGKTNYVYGPNGTPLEQINGTDSVYFHQDQLGSTRALTDGTGSVVATFTYGPYGELESRTGTADTALRWAGQYQDIDTGLYYLRARYYDPTTGQFVTVDPLVGLTLAQYAYGANSPLNATDPTGLSWWNPFSWSADSWHTAATVLSVAAVVVGVGALTVSTMGIGSSVILTGIAFGGEEAATGITLTAALDSAAVSFGAGATAIDCAQRWNSSTCALDAVSLGFGVRGSWADFGFAPSQYGRNNAYMSLLASGFALSTGVCRI